MRAKIRLWLLALVRLTDDPKKSKWQNEHDLLPEWARLVVVAIQKSVGCRLTCEPDDMGISYAVYFKERAYRMAFTEAMEELDAFAHALSAPHPSPKPDHMLRALNLVELVADGDCAFDQPCGHGHRVETHAVYCQHPSWPNSPRKCRRGGDDYKHKDCPGFYPNGAGVTA